MLTARTYWRGIHRFHILENQNADWILSARNGVYKLVERNENPGRSRKKMTKSLDKKSVEERDESNDSRSDLTDRDLNDTANPTEKELAMETLADSISIDDSTTPHIPSATP